jgi:hypothetical protein
MADPKQLLQMLQGDPRFGALAALCDEFNLDERLAAVRGLGKAEMTKLYERAAGQGQVALDYLVPADAPDSGAVWNGKNSLPVFNTMCKTFARAPQPETLLGRNPFAHNWLIGPGYFTCTVSPKQPGEFLIDYTREPAQAPAGWPPVKPNRAGASRLVYFQMHDHLRPVGKNVAIGAAFDARSGKSKNQYFVLARSERILI